MIIFFAGLPGVGKSTLSKAVADALAIHRLEIDDMRREIYPLLDPDYQTKLDNNIPLPDEMDRALFDRICAELRARAGLHEHLIIDELLYKQSLREMVFEAADEHFGGYVTVWIKPDDSLIKKRLSEKPREGHLLKDPVGTYEVFKEKFDPIDACIVFTNEAELADSVEALLPLIREKLKEGTS